ncbi:uncharacterized protein N7496_001840 [Penicillium cataractarum]|uniref:Zn(2)-C6 fungal-type domain-containing protein n=1 Tax=Penicillium cataractarum TaxID=2100454 RepID=A0A9X0B7F9_9EURO|nr:uncharacterized protein N7496_001840 [Penicillium cataractarum]KAJ5390772.1 hypothetical protein N7496_001840 [Penicillium cataractarum]
MNPDPLKPVTLRRSCQACIKGKRRCDQLWPKCSRCLGKGRDCEYANAPLTATSDSRRSLIKKAPRNRGQVALSHQIRTPLRLEIAKEYDQSAIKFLVRGLREYPRAFVTGQKTDFIHPETYSSGLPTAIRDTHILCGLYAQRAPQGNISDILYFLRMKSDEIYRHFSHSSSFNDLLGCSQALILIQCILALNQDLPSQYSEDTSSMLEKVAKRLWEQAPVQLPSTLTQRQAWLLAESVRRTIIVSLMLRSAYSLNTRNYSVRTPFVDALPFDVRTSLWDDDSNHALADQDSGLSGSMISLHEYSDAMERGSVHNINNFGALILAACKGKELSGIPHPPQNSYISS